MKILILLCILAFTLGRSQTMELIDSVVEEDWGQLKEYLNEQKILLIDDMRLSEKNRQKILSLQLPKLKELSFQKPMEFQTNYQKPYDWEVSVTAETLKTVFMSQYFPKLEVLYLFRTSIDDRTLEFLDQVQLKTKIKNLNLQGSFIGKKGFERLSHINFTNLEILNIKDTHLSEDQTISSLIKMICGSETQECQNNLVSLNIQSTNIRRQGFINLFSRLNSSSLRNLTINGLSIVLDKTYKNGFNYSAYEYLSKNYFNIEVLNMKDSFIDDRIAQIFSTWELKRLKTLNVEQNFLSDAGVIKWINSKNMPKISSIFIKSNEVGDGTIGHFIEQAIQFTGFSFGDCLITKEGFESFAYLDFSQLEKLVLYGNINSNTLQYMAYQGAFEQLKHLSIQKSDYITNLFGQLDWSFLPKIETVLIMNSDMSDFYAYTMNFLTGVQISSSLKTLALFETQMPLETLQYMAYSLQKTFPSLQNLIVNQQQSNLYILPQILGGGFINDQTYLNINLMSFQKSNGKFKVLFMTEVFYLIIGQENPTYQVVISRIPGALSIFDLNYLQGGFFAMRQSLDVFFRFLEVAQIKSLPHLKFFQYSSQTDIEFLIDYLEVLQLPSLKNIYLSFIVPGDVQTTFLNNRLIPYLQRFTNLQTLSLNMAFLNQQRGFIQRQELLESLHYPRLKFLEIPAQNMEVQEIEQFLKKHIKTLRIIDLSNNFLEHGLLQILVKYQFILMSLSLSSTSFTVEQFSIIKDLSFDYMRILQLNQNDLTDEHISALIGDKDKGYFKFPKLNSLHLQQNNVHTLGLTSLFETGLYQLKQLLIQGNSNPNFLNIILSYPSRIQSLTAHQIQIYGIQNDLDPLSARNIKAIQIKATSFIAQDFHNLARLNFIKLYYVELEIYNVYECQVLRDILKIAQNARALLLSIVNDQEGLRSQCLKDYKMESKVEVIAIMDVYTTTYIPQFAALALNSASVLKFIAIENTRLSPSFFKKSILPHFNDAFVLFLDRNYFGDEAIKALSTQQDLNAQVLLLKYTNITDSSFKQFTNQKLVQLQIDGNKLGPNALNNLKKSTIPSIQSISLTNCDLDGEDLVIISTFQFANLMELHLDNNNFSQEDILQFVSSLDRVRLPQLRAVTLKGKSLSKEYYKSISQVLKAKSILYELDQSHNLIKVNSAKY